MNQLVAFNSITTPALVIAAGVWASVRFLEFFASNIRNPNTRRAYAHAVGAFPVWCAQLGVGSITAVQPLHVATWIEWQTQTLSAPTRDARRTLNEAKGPSI